MKNPTPAVTYANENSCIEDVLEIAGELSRLNHAASNLESKRKEVTEHKEKSRKASHC